MEKRKYTIIHHISGESNLLTENIHAFNEICKGAVNTEKINFIILTDMMQVKDQEGLLPEELGYLDNPELNKAVIYCVKQTDTHASLTQIKPTAERKIIMGNDNLADTDNLRKILLQVKNTFPADHYAYVYKGHGGADGGDISDHQFISAIITLKADEIKEENDDGVITYAVREIKLKNRLRSENLLPAGWEDAEIEPFALKDITEKPDTAIILLSRKIAKDANYLTNSQLSEILTNVFAEKKLAFVLLDCCWGMSLENIHIFRAATDFLVASADESPASGIGYRQFGEFISREFEYTEAELAKLIVANYFSVNYADYYSPIPLFRKMGVSLSCAATSEIDHLLHLLTKIFSHILEKKRFDRLLQCAFSCRDYTYSTPSEYAVFNVDLVWFLENLIYEKQTVQHQDAELNMLAFEAIKEIKLMVLKGFLGTNYPANIPWHPSLGGYGLTFPFPKLLSHYRESIIEGDGYRIFETLGWKTLLLRFYEYLGTIDPQVLERFRTIVMENLDHEIPVPHVNKTGFQKFMKLDAINKNPDLLNSLKTTELELAQTGIHPDFALNAILDKLNSNPQETVLFDDLYKEIVNQSRFRRFRTVKE